MDTRTLLKALYGTEHFVRDTGRAMGCSTRFVYEVLAGQKPMPRRWLAIMRHSLPLLRVDLGRERERRKAALDRLYADKLAAFDDAARWLERDNRPPLARSFKRNQYPKRYTTPPQRDS